METWRLHILRLLQALERVAEASCKLAIALMATMVLTQVVLRYAFRSPVVWVEEVSIFLMIWVTFIGAGVALRRGMHIAMSFVPERLPPAASRVLGSVSVLVILAFLSVLAWQGWLLAMAAARQQSAALGLSMRWPYLIIPVGAAFMASQLLATVLERRQGAGPLEPERNG